MQSKPSGDLDNIHLVDNGILQKIHTQNGLKTDKWLENGSVDQSHQAIADKSRSAECKVDVVEIAQEDAQTKTRVGFL